MDLIEEIIESIDELEKFDFDKAWLQSIDEEVLDLILELLTKKQLGNQGEGISGDGLDLPEYTPFTINIRSDLGLQTDHMSLEFSGQYLEETDVQPTITGWTITYDEERFDELVFEVGISDTHMTLTEENKQIVYRLIRQKYERIIDQTL